MKLTSNQEKHLESTKWLIDPYDHVGEGRTTVLAFAFIQIAIKHRGFNISFANYVPHVLRQHFRELLYMIIKENYPELNLSINISQASIKVN